MLLPAVLLNLEMKQAKEVPHKVLDFGDGGVSSKRLTGDEEKKQIEETAKLIPPELETYN